jgi:hypothetical protein
MATGTDTSQSKDGGTRSNVVRGAVAAAATGAAAYGVLKLRSKHEELNEEDSVAEEAGRDEGDDGGEATGKRQELTRALATKVTDAKKATSRLKPGGASRGSILDSAWDAASEQLLPIAQEAAAALGATVAKKAPGTVRDELMPRFIEGFQEAN